MQRMRGSLVWRAAVLACTAALAWCSRPADTAPPAGSISVAMSQTRVPLGSPVDMTYRFTVAPDAQPLGTRRVFVHFLDADDELMWTDDHEPPTPTTEWTPGRTIEYSRTMFAPVYPYVGQARVVAGLYEASSNERVRLSGEDRGDRSYLVAQFELLPQTENVFLIFKDGWHAAEVAADNQNVEWQWTKKEATIAFRNPKRDATLYLQLDNPVASSGARQVEVRLGEETLATLRVQAADAPVHRIALPAAQLGAADMVELRLVADRTFVPALEPGTSSGDTRELGARVFHAFVQPR